MQNAELPRLLIVDDEPNVTATLAAIMQREGFQVTEANSGHDGLREAARGRYDVVVTDYAMEDTDGISLIRHLKSLAVPPVCIVLSGFPAVETIEAAQKAGAFDFLIKPCPLEVLIPSIKQGLGHRRDGTSSPAIQERLHQFIRNNGGERRSFLD